jgi:hypothetical protein
MDQRARGRFYVSHELDLRSLPSEKLRSMLRMHCYEDYERLLHCLGLPDRISCGNRINISKEFAFAVVLRRLATPNRWVDCMDFLGRDRTQLSRIFNRTIDLIWEKHGHLLTSFNQPWLQAERVEQYATAVQKACGRYREFLIDSSYKLMVEIFFIIIRM